MGFVETTFVHKKRARFFSFSIKRATTKKKVVSATGSGSVYIVVFKRRFLDVLTLLVEKARRSFFKERKGRSVKSVRVPGQHFLNPSDLREN